VIGQTIGNFEIVAKIGRGGMGEVYLAQQRSIETKVAIKVLQPEVSKDKDHVRRFFNEARAVSRIKHAGIVKIFDVGFHEPTGHAYLIMEYLEGETLGDRIARIKRMPLAKLADVGRQIASVLDATHAVGIIHRDLKPDNIFLVPDNELPSGERVKVLDFGIAKLTDTVNGPRTVGTMGTPTYMAPEQWGDSAHVDWRADMYSLGCVIYEMAVGVPPFNAQSIPELYAQHLTFAAPSMREVLPDLPPTLDQMVLRMLAKNPAARLDAMRDVIRTFDSFTSSNPFVTTIPNRGSAQPGDAHSPPLRESANTRDTTLSRLSQQVATRLGTSERVLPVILISLIGVVLAMIVVVVAKKSHKQAPVAGAVHEVVPAADAAVIAPPPDARELAWPDWIVASNPFVESNGLQVMSHQVTRGEYRRYLATLKGGGTDQAPVSNWDDQHPNDPVAWVPQDRAVNFCASLGATLPSDAQWTQLAHGEWGLDPAHTGRKGPLQEWTSTESAGLAKVRGADEHVPTAERDTYDASPHQKEIADPKHPSRATNIAGERIGFRCVR